MGNKIKLPRNWAEQLIKYEKSVSYDVPSEQNTSFKLTKGKGQVLISAPHGARSFRNSRDEIWHEEDEYTAGMGFLLNEITDVHSIVTVNKNNEFDPNYKEDNPYKETIRQFVEQNDIKFILDLHGAAFESEFLSKNQLIDLGAAGNPPVSIEPTIFNKIRAIIEKRLGRGVTERKGKQGFDADIKNRTITNYCYRLKGVSSLQIEMKPQVRVLERLESATLYKSCGAFAAKKSRVKGMIIALSEVIEFLNGLKDSGYSSQYRSSLGNRHCEEGV